MRLTIESDPPADDKSLSTVEISNFLAKVKLVVPGDELPKEAKPVAVTNWKGYIKSIGVEVEV